jgi:hypothetical protein
VADPVIEIEGPANPALPGVPLERVPFPPAPELPAKPEPATNAPPALLVLYPIPAFPPLAVMLLNDDCPPTEPLPLEVPAAPPAPTIIVAVSEIETADW